MQTVRQRSLFFIGLCLACCAVTVFSNNTEETSSNKITTTTNVDGQANPLGSYDISGITVSGLSAGGFMAVQVHVSHSTIIDGAAIFAAGPFYCARGNLNIAMTECMNDTRSELNAEYYVDLTVEDAMWGKVDPTNSGLGPDRVFLFSGTEDTEVRSEVVFTLQDYYEHFMDTDTLSSNLLTEYGLGAEHCMPTLDYGEPCAEFGSPYIGNCDYDGAGVALQHLMGEDVITTSRSKAKDTKNEASATGEVAVAKKAKYIRKQAADPSRLFPFDQTPYIPAGQSYKSSIGDIGYIYVPEACEESTCSLHISFHGCVQGLYFINSTYAEHAGFNEWADSMNMIVLYPYVKPATMPFNPNGCWDWWGYTDKKDYGVKEGIQIKFIKNLIDQVAPKYVAAKAASA